MYEDRLYDLAFQFKQSKLWKKLYDDHLFAIRHSDDSIGYCCVMGMLGEHIALALYPGEAGMLSYRRIHDQDPKDSMFVMHERFFMQDCVMCSLECKDDLRPREQLMLKAYCKPRGIMLRGKNAHPKFLRFRPHFFPWNITDQADQTRLQEALEAALAVSEKLKGKSPERLGFTEGPPFDRVIPLLTKRADTFEWDTIRLPGTLRYASYSPRIGDEMQLKRIKSLRKRSGEWACTMLMHCEPFSDEAFDVDALDEPEDAPFFPYMLIIVDNDSGMILSNKIAETGDEYVQELASSFIDAIYNHGKPKRILTKDLRTFDLLKNVAGQLGIKCDMEASIPALEEVEEALWGQLSQGDTDTDAASAEVLEILNNEAFLETVPEAMFRQLLKTAQTGQLPPDVVEKIVKAAHKRGL